MTHKLPPLTSFYCLCAMLIPAIAAWAGCEKKELQRIRPGWTLTKGTVTLDQKPLDDARISFVPQGLTPAKNQEKWHSTVILQGEFQIEIPPGVYDVRIQKYHEKPGYVLETTIPMQYDSKTTLSATILLDEPNELSFEILSDAKK